ncbi:MAG: discoidin domain-containing protein [Clostridia bacterium]|nr:discoidin domain-containing protein [Clostridia bacterium]
MNKKITAVISAMLLSFMLGAQAVPSVLAADNSETFDISGFDVAATGGITVYPNNSSSERVIGASEYGFRNSKLMVFDKKGKLIEAGGELLANENGVNGSPQLTVKIPAGGFLVAFGGSAPQGLRNCFNTAMEGAMLYNATMSVIYNVKGSFDKSKSKLKIEYNDPAPIPSGAKRFMFVGNSTTYFNGTPIKFKGLAKAAGVDVHVDYCTFGSAYLSEFADENHARGQAFRTKITQNKYDYVVLQDAASANYTATNASIDVLMPYIEKNGAEALLYMRYGGTVTTAGKHHNSYSRIAKERGLLCAPVADAFIIASEKNSSIDLFADDNSHHSKEGSYLIACVWLKTYLGIDPRGNSYIAELPEKTAKTLQELAVIACEEGYEFEDGNFTYSEEGTEYTNIAAGKKYTSSGAVYNNQNWTDTGSDGKPLGKLTDGIVAVNGEDGAIGCYSGSNVSITVDLGSVSEIKAVKTELYGNDSWGIPNPNNATVTVEISNDGESFISLGEAAGDASSANGNWVHRNFALTIKDVMNARFVRVNYALSGGNFCWTSEIGIFGVEGSSDETSAPDGEESSEPEASEDESSTDESATGESSNDESSTDESVDESNDSAFEEPENKKLTWLYILIAAVAVIAVVAVIVLISKKK